MSDTLETNAVICYHTKVYGMIGEYVEARFARKLERQRDAALFDLDFRRRLGDWQSKIIDDLTSERDEAREYADKLVEGLPDGMLPKDVEVLREANLGLATNIAAVTEQRDRLAEALDKVVDAWDHAEWLDENDFESFRAALQSLPPNEP
jgi:hypothetical protein